MVETRGVNKNQVVLGLWVPHWKISDGKIPGQRIVIGGGNLCSSGNVDELPEQSVH